MNNLDCLKFYEGDVDKNGDEFLSDEKAYVTLNSLLMPGVETEKARLSEGRKLNSVFLKEIDETLKIYYGLLNNMFDFDHDIMHVYRVERRVDYEIFKKEGVFTSFISTSEKGFLKSYQDKFDLVLMDITISKKTLCVRLQDVLDDYKKNDEAEVLIGPYQKIMIEELPLPDELSNIKDGKGHKPYLYCKVLIEDIDDCLLPKNDLDLNNSINYLDTLKEEYKDAYLNTKKIIHNKVIEYIKQKRR